MGTILTRPFCSLFKVRKMRTKFAEKNQRDSNQNKNSAATVWRIFQSIKPSFIFLVFQALVVCFPVICCYYGTIGMDCLTLKFLHQCSRKDRKKVDGTALRGSMVAFFMILPTFVICPILGFMTPMGTDMIKYYISFGVTIGSIVLRNPVVALFTHNVNQKNKKRTAKEIRKANLKKVMDEAEKRRTSRAMYSSTALLNF